MVSKSASLKMSSALKKKIIMSINENIHKKKTIIGKKNVLKKLCDKKIDTIIACNNIPVYLKIQLRLYSKLYGVKLIEFDGGC
mmetsp:Transcript_34357/g.66931  ORF Transcript_34357/g.66931 Transcript_34357/m.66931 type:complete len:83 (-) Transcript_34357:347-595(-)